MYHSDLWQWGENKIFDKGYQTIQSNNQDKKVIEEVRNK